MRAQRRAARMTTKSESTTVDDSGESEEDELSSPRNLKGRVMWSEWNEKLVYCYCYLMCFVLNFFSLRWSTTTIYISSNHNCTVYFILFLFFEKHFLSPLFWFKITFIIISSLFKCYLSIQTNLAFCIHTNLTSFFLSSRRQPTLLVVYVCIYSNFLYTFN